MSKTTNLSALADNARIVGNSVFLEGNSGVFFDDGSSYARGIYSSGTDVRIQTNAMNRLQVDSEGRVTMPYQPYAKVAGGNTLQYVSVENGSPLPMTTILESTGNHYNTTTRMFTCPVAGLYEVSWGFITQNAGEYSHFSVYKNNVNVFKGYEGVRGIGNSFVLKCSAGDTLHMQCLDARNFYDAGASDLYSYISYRLVG